MKRKHLIALCGLALLSITSTACSVKSNSSTASKQSSKTVKVTKSKTKKKRIDKKLILNQRRQLVHRYLNSKIINKLLKITNSKLLVKRSLKIKGTLSKVSNHSKRRRDKSIENVDTILMVPHFFPAKIMQLALIQMVVLTHGSKDKLIGPKEMA